MKNFSLSFTQLHVGWKMKKNFTHKFQRKRIRRKKKQFKELKSERKQEEKSIKLFCVSLSHTGN